MAQFDLKTFNPEAFGRYMEMIPKTRLNELLRSGAVRPTSQFRDALSAQTGGNFATFPLFGRLTGKPLNYDGKTDITATNTNTYSRSVVVTGRANAWIEKDFSEDITGKAGFMSNVARQVGDYWDTVDQNILLTILEGIYSMTGTENENFIKSHTYDISDDSESANMNIATLNTAMQRAAGDNKSIFGLAIMHSYVATNLENERLFKNLTVTDPSGVTRDLGMMTWNGRLVLIDDSMPVESVDTTSNLYTTYVLGNGAFDFDNVGAETPHEMVREAKTNGGQTSLVSRQRKVYAPYGISFVKDSMASDSPTDTELSTGSFWTLVNDKNDGYIDHKAIPIARIISKG